MALLYHKFGKLIGWDLIPSHLWLISWPILGAVSEVVLDPIKLQKE